MSGQFVSFFSDAMAQESPDLDLADAQLPEELDVGPYGLRKDLDELSVSPVEEGLATIPRQRE